MNVSSPYITNEGYRAVPVGRQRSASGYMLEHRLVMERLLGRRLRCYEYVRRKDGNPLNNTPSNLRLVSYAAHWRRQLPVACGICGQVKRVKMSRAKRYKTHYCSHAHRLEGMRLRARQYHAVQRDHREEHEHG